MPDAQINTGTDLSSVVGSINPSQPMDTGTYRKGLSKIETNLEQDRQERKEIPNSPPPQLEPEPQLKDFQTDPWQSFGSFAGVLASLGSLMTRKPLTSALNAGAEVMKARTKGDYQAYTDAYNKWKVNSDNAWKMADWHQTQTKDMYERLKDDQSSLNAEMEVWAKSTQDPTLDHAIKGVDLQNAVLSRDKAMTELKKSNELIKEQHSLTTDYIDQWKDDVEKKTGRRPPDKEVPKPIADQAFLHAKREIEAKGAVGGGGMTDDEYVKFKGDAKNIILADAYANGVPPPELVKGMGKNAGDKLDAIQRLAAERHPNMDIAESQLEYSSRKRELNALATRSAPAKIAVQEMDTLSQPMLTALAKLDPTEYPDLNAVTNAVSRKTGGPEVVAAALAVQEFKTAFTNLMVRNGVATDQARSRADEIISMNMPLGQAQAVVDQAKISGGAVIEALSKAKKGIETGKEGASSTAPEGVDAKIWAHMTPEEKALWQN